jgi:hypothetical protein
LLEGVLFQEAEDKAWGLIFTGALNDVGDKALD